MKRLIVCCDGTWNNPKQEDNGIPAPTNVVKFYNALADVGDGGVRQVKFYHPGLGGEEIGIKEKLLGGALGIGITRHICSAYHWLGNNYSEGDEIYLFGFSRGAFTVRCLGGLLGKGLLNLRGVKSRKSWSMVKTAFSQGYRRQKSNWEKDWKLFHNGGSAPVKFLGVWDTVGALGIPDDLELLNLFDKSSKWQFHDADLGVNVQSGRHAMALDEMRSSFTVTRWTNADSHSDIVETWFSGVHSDVGGGYASCDLSNGALKWMMEQAKAEVNGVAGLKFRVGVENHIVNNPLGVMHNSFKGVFSKMRSRPRNIPAVKGGVNGNLFHAGVLKRQKFSPLEYTAYHPTRELRIGDSVSLFIFADTRWNRTGLYFSEGQKYVFSASGEWQDSADSCTWEGTKDGKLTVGDVIRGTSSFLGKFENIYKKFTGNQSTDFLGTKRVERLNWFTMVGAITNDNGGEDAVANDGSPTLHEYIDLVSFQDEDDSFEVTAGGYFYAFPNDVWSLYDNNHGSVELTVERVG